MLPTPIGWLNLRYMSRKIPSLHLASKDLYQIAIQSQRRREKRRKLVQSETVVVSFSCKAQNFWYELHFSLYNLPENRPQTDSMQSDGNTDSTIIELPYIPPNFRLVNGRIVDVERDTRIPKWSTTHWKKDHPWIWCSLRHQRVKRYIPA